MCALHSGVLVMTICRACLRHFHLYWCGLKECSKRVMCRWTSASHSLLTSLCRCCAAGHVHTDQECGHAGRAGERPHAHGLERSGRHVCAGSGGAGVGSGRLETVGPEAPHFFVSQRTRRLAPAAARLQLAQQHVCFQQAKLEMQISQHCRYIDSRYGSYEVVMKRPPRGERSVEMH